MTKAALAIQGRGKGNWTIPGTAWELTNEMLERWATVARLPKFEGRNIAIFRVGSMNRKLEMLYRWHVAEGFSHADGWWVEVCE